MRYFYGVSVFLNCLLIAILMWPEARPLDASVAKLVVQEEIQNISNETFGGQVSMGAACAEQAGNEGIVSGKGQTMRRARTMAGVNVIEQTQFSYEAEVLNRCTPGNLNCYDIRSLGFSGINYVEPKI
ncbi:MULTISPECIES: hypothetical protein [Rhodomicrobium]|uniref:hypothetical protein n=1 Tax=Rhodomicrobium TaxID=1068 RepID=UPI000B4AE0D0|nr:MULTISPECIES: hypothetical protein [Rhodomicrobium]